MEKYARGMRLPAGRDKEPTMGRIFTYTRVPEETLYRPALAGSVHLAWSLDGERYEPLNQNYGMLFATGAVTEQNTIAPKALRDPRILRRADGAYLIQARQTDEAGEAEPLYPQWITADFRTFRYLGAAETPQEMPPAETGTFGIPGIVPGNSAQVDDALGLAALTAWSPLVNTAVRVPELVPVRCAADAEQIRATAVYSDGSACEKAVRWNLAEVDFSRAGDVRVTGTAQQLEPGFPIFRGHGDPVLFPWRGKWHYLFTNDTTDDRGFIVRRADTVAGLFAEHAEQSLILDVSERFVQTFWAPEFHEIGNELYILFAVSGAKWGPQCHLMRLKPGGDILCPEDWTEPERVRRRDGAFLAEEAITLDMTYLSAGGRSYVVWSHREHIGTPLDSGSMLYIAAIDPRNPARLTSEPVLLSRPLYGWENIDGTINNEGPHAFVRGGTVYLAYSGGSANRYSYAVGLFTADAYADLLKVENWSKRPSPVLRYDSVPGRFGPGHNSFFEDGGQLYIAYHAEYNTTDSPRCAALHRVAFDRTGAPRFDLPPERDLNPALRTVSTTLRVL